MPAGTETGAAHPDAAPDSHPHPGAAMPRVIIGYTLGIATAIALRATWRAILGWALSRGD